MAQVRGSTSTRHLRLYAYVWLGYFVLLLLLPIRYSRLQAAAASLGMASWVLVSLLAGYVTHHICSRKGLLVQISGAPAERALRVPQLERLVWLALAMSVVGFVCLAYDRLVVQGIDFSQGIAVARELWKQEGEKREGVSSIFSVLGYLLGFSFTVASTLGHLHWESLSTRTRRGVIVLVTLLVALNSLLTGGRSIVLVQLACVAATGSIRAMLGLKMLPGRGTRIWLGIMLAFVVSVGYSLYVFSARAEAGNVLPQLYVTSVIEWLGGEPTDGFYRLSELPDSIAGTLDFGIAAGAYLTHSYATFEGVLEDPARPGSASFALVHQVLAKLGIAPEPTEEWSLSGHFLSLPGSLFYDFGWLGCYAGAVLFGVLLGLTPRLLAARSGGGISLMIVAMVFVTGMVAPLVVSVDILSVPFLIVGFVQVDLLNRLLGGPRNWLYVSRPARPAYMEETIGRSGVVMQSHFQASAADS